MNETVGVQVDKGQCYVVADVQLNVVGQWSRGSLQEPAKALVTQFHQKNRQAGLGVAVGGKVLHDVGVPGQAKKATLLFKPFQIGRCSRVTQVEQCGVHDLGSTGEAITLGPTDSSIRARAQRLRLVQLDSVVPKLNLLLPLSHGQRKSTVNGLYKWTYVFQVREVFGLKQLIDPYMEITKMLNKLFIIECGYS